MGCSAACRSCSISTRRRILPDAALGISSTNSTRRIFLCGGTRSATKAISSPGAPGGPRDTERLGAPAGLLVGVADPGGVAARRVGEEHRLQLGRGHLEA